MTDNTTSSDDVDQDSETMLAPPEGRPEGAVSQEEGPHAQDADDQPGSEEPS